MDFSNVLRGRIKVNFYAENVKLVCVVKLSNVELYMESFIVDFLLVSKSNCSTFTLSGQIGSRLGFKVFQRFPLKS